MTDIEDNTSEAPHHHSYAATIAPFCVLLLGLFIVIGLFFGD
jgi:hypothetical protein